MRVVSTEPFYSKSNSIGSIRWAIDGASYAPFTKGYVLDTSWAKGQKYYAILLGKSSDQRYELTVSAVNSIDPPVVLSDLVSALEIPVLKFDLGIDEAKAIEKFERASSNVMHGRLEPTEKVKFVWEKILQE